MHPRLLIERFLFSLTHGERYSLSIELMDAAGNARVVRYTHFELLDNRTFALSVDGMDAPFNWRMADNLEDGARFWSHGSNAASEAADEWLDCDNNQTQFTAAGW